jgi:hypothetical protein
MGGAFICPAQLSPNDSIEFNLLNSRWKISHTFCEECFEEMMKKVEEGKESIEKTKTERINLSEFKKGLPLL